MSEGLAFDHVILGVRDLDAGAGRLWEEQGLKATGGGVHPGGTRNLGVRFVDGSYLELLAVQDASLPLGGWLERLIRSGDRLVGWAVRTDAIDAVAARVGMEAQVGSIEMPDGTRGTWRTVGTTRLVSAPSLPFFIQYDATPEGSARIAEEQSAAMGAHRIKPLAIAWVEVSGDRSSLEDWLGDAQLDVRFVEGGPGLHAAGIRTDGGEIVIR
jgi:hypothetical protein